MGVPRPSAHVAAAKGDLEYVARSLKAGDLEGADAKEPKKGDTCLHKACAHAQTRVAAELLKTHHANAGVKNDAGATALHEAAAAGALACVDLLLNHRVGVSVLSRDNHGRMPLHAAAAGGHADVVSALANARNAPDGAVAAAPRADGETAVRYVDEPDAIGYTPLHTACRHGHAAAAAVLLEAGADAHTRARGGATPLHDAARYGHDGAVRALLAQEALLALLAPREDGARLLDARDDKGATPWDAAGGVPRVLAALRGEDWDEEVEAKAPSRQPRAPRALTDAEVEARTNEARKAAEAWSPFGGGGGGSGAVFLP